MRMVLGLLLLVVAPVGWSQKRVSSQEPFSLSLTVLTPDVESGAPVLIKVLITNMSKHDVDCSKGYSNGLDRTYTYEVKDPGGKPLEMLTKKHPEIGATFSPGPECLLKPGETSSSEGSIGNFYDMTGPGEYSIRVSRRISDDPKDGVIYSNKATVTIVKREKAPPAPDR